MSFWYLQFSQKTNEKIQLHYYGTSSRIVFVRFLGELKIPKRHFEVNWPLVLKISSKKVRKTQNWLHPLICETLDRPSVYLHKDIVKENKPKWEDSETNIFYIKT